MNSKFSVLTILVILLSLQIYPNYCDDQLVRNVKPIISELFDMLIENIEAKRKEKDYLNNLLIKQEEELNHDLIGDKEQETITNNKKAINKEVQNRIKVVEREILILDGQISLKLGIIVSLVYGNNSVLVFKQWNENYSKISTDYGLLCSSSNINSNFIVNPSEFREIEGNNKNHLVFETRQEVSNLKEKTFLLCLSDSITSNHSIYITKLSFSSNIEPEGNQNNKEKNFNQFKDLEYYEFTETNKHKNDSILVRTRIPNNQKCLNFELILLDNHKIPTINGELLSESSITNSENICFWSLKLENLLFKNNNMMEIVQRHKQSRETLPISIVKLRTQEDKNNANRFVSFNSLLFKLLILILNFIPILMLTFGIYVILAESWLIISKSSKCQQRTNNHTKEIKSIKEIKENSWDSLKNESKPEQISSFNIITRKNLNSEESGISSGESEQMVKDDPFRYFDSDCSISTHTGI